MSKLSWNGIGERFYETGIDRGVLYVHGMTGVPWNGLLSVSESPSGGDAVPYYFDGQKYVNVSSAEEFEASIDAFSAPTEFRQCDGMASVQNGLFITQQPRKTFDLSYRTTIGNDLEGTDKGYKLHIVYNALASASNHTSKSMGGSSEADTFSWDITTTPSVVPGIKSTAHLVVDSRRADRLVLGYLESILYGTAQTAPRMPTPGEIVALFGWSDSGLTIPVNVVGTAAATPTALVTNLYTHPSFEIPSTSYELRRNRANAPRATSGTYANGTLGWAARWYGSAPAAGTTTLVTGATDGPPGTNITSYMRKTWTVASTSPGDTGFSHCYGDSPTGTNVNGYPVTPGQTYAISSYIRATSSGTGRTVRVSIYWRDAAGAFLSESSNTSIDLVSGVWTRPGTVASAPAGAAFMGVNTDPDVGPGWAIGDKLEGTGLLVEIAPHVQEYIDGECLSVGDFAYNWLGTVNNSASVQTVLALPATNITSATTDEWQSSQWSGLGMFSACVRSKWSSSDTFIAVAGLGTGVLDGVPALVAGKKYTVIATLRIENALMGSPNGNGARQIVWIGGPTTYRSTQTPNLPGVYEHRLTFTADSATYAQLRLYNGHNSSGGAHSTVWWDDLTIVEVPSVAQPYTGPAFNGSNPVVHRNQDPVKDWVGADNTSTSTITTYDSLNALAVSAKQGDGYLISGSLWVFDRYFRNYGIPPT